MKMKIRIQDLRLRTIVGCNDWEREKRQDVIINVKMKTDATKAISSDDLADSVDYREVTKRIIEFVEGSEFFLVEKLAAGVLDLVMLSEKVLAATVRVDKPHALRFSKSVSVELSAKR